MTRTVDLDQEDLKHGVLGLVVALVEIIKDALQLEAVRRMEGGDLNEAEMDRLGEALMDLNAAIHQIQVEQGIAESVRMVRRGLDSVVEDILDSAQGNPIGGQRMTEDTNDVPAKTPGRSIPVASSCPCRG